MLFGISNVPLFPSLIGPLTSIDVLVSTATSAARALRSATDLVAEELAENARAAAAQ